MSTCCLCSNLVSVNRGEFWNKPLFQSANFVVIPSLGSLIEGWVMIVPKQHYLSMGALSPVLALEMQEIKLHLSRTLRSQYGNVCAFEHGPTEVHRSVGCGVDHAHLHVVPLRFDLAAAVRPFMPPDTEWVAAQWDSCRNAFETGRDYLYLEQPIGNGHIALHREFGSQVFRKAIASGLGIPDQFNWRNYPQKEIVARTIHALTGPVLIAR
jgi:ATP adenylyltransferase